MVKHGYLVARFPGWLAVCAGAFFILRLGSGCTGDDGKNADTEVGDAGKDTGPEGDLYCMDCHLDEEMLIASLEADPLPVEEEPPESEGEG